MTRTFVDASVLIAAARGQAAQAQTMTVAVRMMSSPLCAGGSGNASALEVERDIGALVGENVSFVTMEVNQVEI